MMRRVPIDLGDLGPLADPTEEERMASKKNDRSIYKLHVSCGRHGDLNGQFTATAGEVAAAIGKEVHFYEPWGKHSEASVTLEAAHFKIVSSDPAEVRFFARANLASGKNPLAILADQEA